MSHGSLWLVRLSAPSAALHLTRQANLDALELDDRISTGRLDLAGPGGDPLLNTSQALSDALFDWWDASPPPIVYRTRSLPSGRSMAFTEACAWDQVDARRLADAQSLLVDLVLRHGFDVPERWLAS